MSIDLTETQNKIQGIFWLPEHEDQKFSGVLRRKAGQSARLDTASFNYAGLANLFPSRPEPKEGEALSLMGDEVHKAMFPQSHKLIHGHDEHGNPITLYKCHAGSSRSTMAMASNSYSCSAAIFGVHLKSDDLKCDGIRIHLDHLDSWVGRRAFQRYQESYETENGDRKLSKLIIPIARSLSIPLDLPSYSRSEFFCAWRLQDKEMELRLTSRVYLDLYFDAPREWSDVLDELHRWRWLLSLATRSSVDIREFAIFRSDVRYPIGEESMEACGVWTKRDHAPKAPKSKLASHAFYFSFSDIETLFPEIIRKWNNIQKPWAAVLHRFFAVSNRRGLWINEIFLFLAQAVESLHRARSGDTDSKGVIERAAKNAYQNSPEELRQLLGDRGLFVRQFRKTRNYWSHYGEPTPQSDPEVLSDLELLDFTDKLRWIVEYAILREIGIPELCASKVWSPQWRGKIVTFE